MLFLMLYSTVQCEGAPEMIHTAKLKLSMNFAILTPLQCIDLLLCPTCMYMYSLLLMWLQKQKCTCHIYIMYNIPWEAFGNHNSLFTMAGCKWWWLAIAHAALVLMHHIMLKFYVLELKVQVDSTHILHYCSANRNKTLVAVEATDNEGHCFNNNLSN